MNKGFFYIASGTHFLMEAVHSCKSLKKYTSSPVAIATDLPNLETAKLFFDVVIPIDTPAFNFIDKIEPLTRTPFRQTIFLDTDTFLLEDISPLFSILDKYDFAACFAPGRVQMKMVPEIPDWFPEFNTGVIGFNKSDVCEKVIAKWLYIYRSQLQENKKPPHDQPAFRQAMFESGASIYALPEEFNFRTAQPNVVWANSKVKVIHGRHSDYEKLGTLLSSGKRNEVQLFFHDARFLTSRSLRFFLPRQNRSLLLSFALWLTGLMNRLRYRVVSNNNPVKRKGNPRQDVL